MKYILTASKMSPHEDREISIREIYNADSAKFSVIRSQRGGQCH